MSRHAYAAIALTAILSLAACNDDSSSDAPAASGSGVAKAAPKGGTAAAPKGSFHVCQILPPAELTKITGKSFNSAEPREMASYQVYGCSYKGGAGVGEQLDITVDGKYGQHQYNTDLDAIKQIGHPVKMISGIGDQAFSGGDTPTAMDTRLGVLYGDTYIKVGGFSDVTEAQAEEIVKRVHAAY